MADVSLHYRLGVVYLKIMRPELLRRQPKGGWCLMLPEGRAPNS